MLALDCETCLIQPGLQIPPLVCVSTDDGTGPMLCHHTDRKAILACLDADRIVGLNISYDLAVIAHEFEALDAVIRAYEEDRVTDVGIRQRLIDIATGTLGWMDVNGKRMKNEYSLEDVALLHLGIQMDKKNEWRMRFGELRDVPVDWWPAPARAYALQDAVVPLAVYHKQERYTEWLEDQYRQARADFWIKLMSAWGLVTDPARVEAFERAAKEDYDRLAAQLVEYGLKRPDRTNRKGALVEGSRDKKAAQELVEFVCRRDGIPVPRTAPSKQFPDGQVKTDKEFLLASSDPALRALGEFQHAEHVLSTEVELVKRGLIHSRFTSLVATGRTSSSPNVQNMPTKVGMRECFVPRPGRVLVACDYEGMELRTWSQVCLALLGHSKMADVLNADGDPHSLVAADILHVSIDEALQRKKLGKDKDPDAYKARQCGKVVNFGCPGGMGAGRLVHAAKTSYGVEISESRAAALKKTWLATWPEAGEYLEVIRRLCEPNWVQIEQYKSRRFRGGLGYCDCANTFFQGLAADAAKAAGWLIMKACYQGTLPDGSPSALYGSRIVNFIHDEFLLECPAEIGHECADDLSSLMIQGAQPWVPDVKITTEAVIMTAWSKGAKRMRDADGRLVAWSPDEAA